MIKPCINFNTANKKEMLFVKSFVHNSDYKPDSFTVLF